MKFYAPKPGTSEDVNMSGDNSDDIPTDGGTPPERNNHNINTSENSSTTQNDDIALNLRRLTAAQEVIEEIVEENPADQELSNITKAILFLAMCIVFILYVLCLSWQVYKADTPTPWARGIYNVSTVPPDQQLSLPVAASNFFNHDKHILSTIASDDDQNIEESNSNNRSSDY